MKKFTEQARAAAYRKQLHELAENYPDAYQQILYDAIFVDEGQDFEPEEYMLLLDLLHTNPKTEEKNLIIFYDDAQNIYGRHRPVWRTDVNIDLRGGRSHVMRECFRNSREVVELAFNVLLGSQSPDVQRVQTRTYADVNYLQQLELVEDLGDHIRVRFATRNYEKPRIFAFQSREDEKNWIAAEIFQLVEQEEVRPEDILILFHKKAAFKDLSTIIHSKTSNRIQGFVQPHTSKEDRNSIIFRPNHLTLSTTYSAKGYDANIVFLVGTDLFELDKEGRASFYVGATRCKMRLYLTGLDKDDTLLKEAQAVHTML